MATSKYDKSGRRVNLWIPHKYLKMYDLIDNKSNFLQIALMDAPGIMAWAMLHNLDREKYYSPEKLEDVLPEFNRRFPVDPLTAKRKQQCTPNSPKKPELW